MGYIGLGFALLSVSGIILMSWATLELLWYMTRERPQPVVAVLILLCLCGPFTCKRYADEVEVMADAAALASESMASPTNGFSGRFSPGGTMYSTVDYIAEHPFRPVGVGYNSRLFFGDSGPVEHYLRGSFFLVAAVYGGLFLFLRKNLVSRRDAHHLFAVIMLFELGFSTLVNIRFLCILPALVVYLNDLRRSNEVTSGVTAAPAAVLGSVRTLPHPC